MQKQQEQPQKQAHDVIYSALYAKTLATKDKTEQLKAYLSKFFFAYANDVFYDNGEKYQLYDLTQAKKLLAKDLAVFESKNELFNSRHYLESTEFKAVQYQPAIDFTKEKVFIDNVIIRGVKMDKNKLNMAKSLRSLDFHKEIDRKVHGPLIENDLRTHFQYLVLHECRTE